MNRVDTMEKQIEFAEEQLKLSKKLITLTKELSEIKELKSIPFFLYPEKLVFTPPWKELTTVRKELRKHFGAWNDKFNSIDNPYDDLVLIRYKSISQPYIQIWARSTIKDTPKEFLKNGCRWVVSKQNCKSFVCDLKK